MNVQAAFSCKVRLLLKCSYRMSICGQKEPPVGHPVVHPPNKAHLNRCCMQNWHTYSSIFDHSWVLIAMFGNFVSSRIHLRLQSLQTFEWFNFLICMIFTFEMTMMKLHPTSLNATGRGYKLYRMWLRLQMALVIIYVNESGFILSHKALGDPLPVDTGQ